MDNFDCDPYTGVNMLKTAENVAAEYGLTTAQQNELTLVRYQQYEEALKNDSAFLRRFLKLPFSVPDARFKREQSVFQGAEGIFPTTEAGLAQLKPIIDGGPDTVGGQTPPPRRHAAHIITTTDGATELTQDQNINNDTRSPTP